MLVRKYQPGEETELWLLFFNTIRTVNVQDYTQQQVRVWAPDDMDPDRWRSRIEGIDPFVCVHDGRIVGYADVQDTGYIDHFYVHHQWQRQGVGKRLMAAIEVAAGRRRMSELSANVSITARPFFESQGFEVITPQEVKVGTTVFINFKMVKRRTVEASTTQK